jgi:hypothetical protein
MTELLISRTRYLLGVTLLNRGKQGSRFFTALF